jgi:predicted nuclease of predicted toxin-antitoxin system
MSILLDHCTPRRYAKLLRQWGYSADLITTYIAADAADPNVLALAQSLDAVLLTVDLDFANILHYPPQSHVGVIVLRYQVQDEAAVDSTLLQALADLYRSGLRQTLLIVEPHRYRIRRQHS